MEQICMNVSYQGFVDKCKHCGVEDVSVLAIIKKGHRVQTTIWVDSSKIKSDLK